MCSWVLEAKILSTILLPISMTLWIERESKPTKMRPAWTEEITFHQHLSTLLKSQGFQSLYYLKTMHHPHGAWMNLQRSLSVKEKNGQIVQPVFYKVHPYEVRQLTNTVGQSFAKLEERTDDQMKVQRWKTALAQVANLFGWHLDNNRYFFSVIFCLR